MSISDYGYHEKTRFAGSKAVIALRKRMGKTQQTFAVEVLDTAITTVARYETSHPPRGDVLLRLAEIAERESFFDIRDTFRELYVEEVFQKFNFNLMVVPATETTPLHGYLVDKLENAAEIALAQKYMREKNGESDDGMMAQIQKAVLGAASGKKPNEK